MKTVRITFTLLAFAIATIGAIASNLTFTDFIEQGKIQGSVDCPTKTVYSFSNATTCRDQFIPEADICTLSTDGNPDAYSVSDCLTVLYKVD